MRVKINKLWQVFANICNFKGMGKWSQTLVIKS